MVRVTIGDEIGRGFGSISAANVSRDAAQSLASTVVDHCLEPISPDAPGCCIDGRCALHTMAGEETKLELGPHIAGGPLLTAFGAAELVSGFYADGDESSVMGRLEEVEHILTGMGIKLGAHITELAARKDLMSDDGLPQTGCGLNDKFQLVVAMSAQFSEQKAFIDATTGLLIGDAYNPNAMRFNTENEVTHRVVGYNSRDVIKTFVRPDGRNADKVEVLAGEHAERLVVFNYVENTTVDRDKLTQQYGRQVFIVDMWYIDKLAEALAHGRPDAVEMADSLKHAMVAFQVATYLVLCDGTHRPALLKLPQTQEAVALAS